MLESSAREVLEIQLDAIGCDRMAATQMESETSQEDVTDQTVVLSQLSVLFTASWNGVI
jgi:hypothetical protein